MTTLTTWLLGESCPDCDAPLTLLDDGASPARAECGSCGYADVRAVTVPAGGEAGDRYRQDDTGAADGHAAGP